MVDVIIGTIGGTVVIIGIAAYLGRQLNQNFLKKDLEDFKSKIQRDLTVYSRSDAYIRELAIRQLDAAQEMWLIFENTSLNGRKNSIIQSLHDAPYFDYSTANQFIGSLDSTFSRKAGLYISKPTRIKLFEFRDFISNELLEKYKDPKDKFVTEEQVANYKKLRTAACLAIRNEIGGENITIAREEYIR